MANGGRKRSEKRSRLTILPIAYKEEVGLAMAPVAVCHDACKVLPSFVSLSEDIQFDDLVTAARPCFQARSVEDRELASDVADQFPLLEGAGYLGDALSAHPQHVGEELLGEPEFV